ncbi:uncharacterized protein LOC125424111 isoform X2 [Ziziphus jujuba]|uniref:Uncharacterized protein LOC125424111 isoform X2 n=1 Tax=Ziziphus jujuba TaxID=326968 RepID=A0ABM4A5E2_ZIZJJ|nr:uncharacterized protein LOC125424111 isoform X2 [Ziziphus jujuba]
MDDINSSSSSSSDEEFQDFMMFLDVCEYTKRFLEKIPQRTSMLSGQNFITELLNGSEKTCYELFRMDKNIFLSLCTCLKQHEYLKDTKEVRVEEALAMFLIIIGHNVGMRLIADRFQHSLETVDRHFTLTLRAICRLGKELICHTNSPLPSHIVNNPKYFPWFEGTANDSRVFLDAITRSENKFPLPKEGEYYVVDSGFPCTMGFLPPFRGERYHLQEYHGRGRQPRGPKELFNYRHSSLRNVIERCFGVLKARFRILKMMPPYKQSRQPLIVIACCTLHNFIRKSAQNDVMFTQWEEEEQEIEDEEASTSGSNNSIDLSDEAATAMAAYRNQLSQVMWHDYVIHM